MTAFFSPLSPPPTLSHHPHYTIYQCSTVPLPGSTGTRGAAQLWTLLPAPSQPPPPAAPDRPPLQHADYPTWGSGAPLALTGHGTLEQPTALLRNVLTSDGRKSGPLLHATLALGCKKLHLDSQFTPKTSMVKTKNWMSRVKLNMILSSTN